MPHGESNALAVAVIAGQGLGLTILKRLKRVLYIAQKGIVRQQLIDDGLRQQP